MEFKEKLSRLSKIYKNRPDELEKHKLIWIREVKYLYENIETWFGEYIQNKDIIVDYDSLKFAECSEFEEELSIMYLYLGGEQGPSIILEPTGINIAGALGKIDLYFRGHKEEGVFLLLIEDNDEKIYWEIWKSRKQKEKIKKFTKESFENLIGEWLEEWTDI